MPSVRICLRLAELASVVAAFFVSHPLHASPRSDEHASVEAEDVYLEEDPDPVAQEDVTSDGGPSEPVPWPRRKVVFYPRQGMLIFGPGQRVTERCSGSDCPVERVDYTQAFRLQPGIDVLMHLSPKLRLGIGFTYTSDVEVSVERYQQSDLVKTLGTEITIPFSAEYVLRAGQEVMFPLRIQPQLLFMFPGKRDVEDTCENTVGLTGCQYRQSPFPGFGLGATGGVLWNLAPVGLRAEGGVQYVYETSNAWEAHNSTNNRDESQYRSYSGFRFVLQVGLEI